MHSLLSKKVQTDEIIWSSGGEEGYEGARQEALRIRQELEAWAEIGETLHALAEVYKLRGDWAKAAEMAEQAAGAWRRAAEGSG